MMARSTKSSNQRPDTLMQDRTSAVSIKVLLQRTAGPYMWVKTGSALVEHKISASPPKTRHLRVNEYTAFCNGPGDVKFPRVIVTPPSSRFCPWSAPRPPHYAVRRNGEPSAALAARQRAPVVLTPS